MSSNPYDPAQSAYPPSGPYSGSDGPYQSQQPFTGYPPQPDPAYQQPAYGQPQQPYFPPAYQPGVYTPQQGVFIAAQAAPANGPGIASLVLGIIGLLLCWVPFVGLVLSIVGLVLGVAGMKRLSGKGMAIAGLVLSIIALVLSACITISLFTSFIPFFHYYNYGG